MLRPDVCRRLNSRGHHGWGKTALEIHWLVLRKDEDILGYITDIFGGSMANASRCFQDQMYSKVCVCVCGCVCLRYAVKVDLEIQTRNIFERLRQSGANTIKLPGLHRSTSLITSLAPCE